MLYLSATLAAIAVFGFGCMAQAQEGRSLAPQYGEAEEHAALCLRWAQENLNPVRLAIFERLNPGDMSDDDRAAWGAVLTGQLRVQDTLAYYSEEAEFGVFPFASKQVEWCRDYWSEALEEENADKRNHELWEVACKGYLPDAAWGLEERVREAFIEHGPDGMTSKLTNQVARILNWTDMNGVELLAADPKPGVVVRQAWQEEKRDSGRYREENWFRGWQKDSVPEDDLERWWIERAWNLNWYACKNHFPQLFFGRWVPLDDGNADRWQEGVERKVAEIKATADWPSWADGPDRQIWLHATTGR